MSIIYAGQIWADKLIPGKQYKILQVVPMVFKMQEDRRATPFKPIGKLRQSFADERLVWSCPTGYVAVYDFGKIVFAQSIKDAGKRICGLPEDWAKHLDLGEVIS